MSPVQFRVLPPLLVNVFSGFPNISETWQNAGFDFGLDLDYFAASSKIMKPRTTAYHEAAHSAVGFFLGIKIISATIQPNKASGYAGSVRWKAQVSKSGTWGNNAIRMRRAVMALAGPAAHKKIDPRAPWKKASADDIESVRHYIMSCCSGDEKEGRAMKTWLTIRAERMVVHHWSAISRLAEALLKEKTLTGDQIAEIIGVSFPSPAIRQSFTAR